MVAFIGGIWTLLFVPDYAPLTDDDEMNRKRSEYHAEVARLTGNNHMGRSASDGDGDGTGEGGIGIGSGIAMSSSTPVSTTLKYVKFYNSPFPPSRSPLNNGSIDLDRVHSGTTSHESNTDTAIIPDMTGVSRSLARRVNIIFSDNIATATGEATTTTEPT